MLSGFQNDARAVIQRKYLQKVSPRNDYLYQGYIGALTSTDGETSFAVRRGREGRWETLGLYRTILMIL